MAGIVGIFASIGEHIPILKREKFTEPQPEGIISHFHFRGTVILITVFVLMTTTPEWISGTDSLIDCIVPSSMEDSPIQTYCYIMGTFSVPKHYVDSHGELGNRVSQTGVGPYDPTSDYIEIKAYYQWVPFMLALQAVMFYVPHIIYKYAEGDKVRQIIAGLNLWVIDNEERAGKEQELANYVVETRGTHREWCFKILLAQCVYLVNVIGNMFFTDCFLGWEFYTYGVQAASFLENNPADRIDPMSRVFPRVTKCTFRKFGPSGTIQRLDSQCVLPINIINEKIYVFMWFWFALLSILTTISLLWAFSIVFAFTARRTILHRKLRMSPKRDNLKVDLNLILENFDFGDWKLMYHLLQNMDALVFGEFMEELTKRLRKAIEEETKDDTLSLDSLLSKPKELKSNINKADDDDDDVLKLNTDGNYLKPKEAEV